MNQLILNQKIIIMMKNATMTRWFLGLVMGMFLFAGFNHTALAQGPPGSTCENPLVVDPVASPLVNFAINSEAYGNNYTAAMVTPSTNYLNGYDVVFQFTLASKSFVNASIAGSWTGLTFVATCPNLAAPPPRIAFAGSGTGATVPQFQLDPGTYFMIAGTWPTPDFTDMVINFSATPIPTGANLVSNVSNLNAGWAVPGFDTQTRRITITNQGLGDAIINPSAVSFTGPNAANFSAAFQTTAAPASITPVTTLMDMLQATGNLPAIIDNAGNNRGAAFNGQYVFVASRQNGNYVYYWDVNNPTAPPSELNLTGISGGTFTLSDMDVVGNHIFVSNMVFVNGEFKVYHWNGVSAQPTVLLSYPAAPARLGDAFSVVGDPATNALLIASGHGTKDFYVWSIVNGQIPNTTPVIYNFPTILNANFGRVVAVPGTNNYIASGSGFGVLLLDAQMNILAEIPSAWFPYWSMYPRVFTSSGQRYLALHHVKTGTATENIFYVLDLSGDDLVAAFQNIAAGVFADKVVHTVNLGSIANGNASVSLDMVADAQQNPVFMAYSAGNGFIVQKFTNTQPLVLPFGQSRNLDVTFNPTQNGDATATLNIPFNGPQSPLSVGVQGVGYQPMTAFSQNFDEVTVIPAGWMPNGWSGLVQSTAATAVVDIRNVGAPISLPNHARLFFATDLSANVLLISPVATNLANSWVRFAAKMAVSTHTGNVQVGYTTSRTNPASFVPVGTIGVTGTYANYNVSFLGSGITFPEHAYVAFRFVPEVASRTLYIDDVVYETVPTQPVFTANKTEVNFGTGLFINETAANTLTITNTGAGTLTINQNDVTITGADASAFSIVYPEGHTWPIALTTGQTFTFNLRLTPTQARLYNANLNIQDNIGTKAVNVIPMLGTGYDAVLQPGFMFDFVGTWPPLDWRKFEGNIATTAPFQVPASTIWNHMKFGNNTDLPAPNSARINLYSTGRRHWLMSPPIQLDAGKDYMLEFDLALTLYNTPNPATLGPSHKFAVVISTDGGLTWSVDNVLQWWNESTPISNTGDEIAISLSGYSGRVMLGFYGESTVTGGDVDLFFRNVTV